jgi:glycosyltransferase involved in cell wall biosynthesis
MSTAQVSVVIPAHNGAAFLVEAVASVRAQTMPPAEIIVVDDGSTDDTAQVVAALGSDIRCLHQPRRGEGAARNRGAERAGGEWLAFLDADDLWLPEKLAVQLDWMRTAPQTEAVFGHASNFTLAADGARRDEASRPGFLPSAAFLRRGFYLQRARFDEAVVPNATVGWHLKLLAAGVKMAVVPELVLRRRVHAGNTRRQGDGGRAADLRLLRGWIHRRRQD